MMKRGKKWIGLAMAAVMMGSVAVSVCASDTGTTNDMNQDTTSKAANVNYQEPNKYTISIPADVTLTSAGGSLDITAKLVNLAPDKKVEVKVTGGLDNSGNVTLTGEAGINGSVTSSVKYKNAAVVQNSTVVAEFSGSFTTAQTSTLSLGAPTAETAGSSIRAGAYTGKLTFGASITSSMPSTP